MTFKLPSLQTLDQDDNPYMPHHLQNISLYLNPGHFLLQTVTLPVLPPTGSNTASMDGANRPVIITNRPVNNNTDELDNIDDNSSDTLDSIEDHEFPSFFSQRSSPPRLFHSHGTYNLPVDSDETKVCTSGFGTSRLCNISNLLKKLLPLSF